MTTHDTIIHFWFEELKPAQWWKKDSTLDQLIRERFLDIHTAAAKDGLSAWRAQAEGRLAEVIVLDQFSRNMFRDTPQAFAYDKLALVRAQEAVQAGDDQKLSAGQRAFLYMPYMHSESRQVHEESLRLFTALWSNLEFAEKHKAIIDEFGRYPHRNAILGRESTAEEIEFLKNSGSSF